MLEYARALVSLRLSYYEILTYAAVIAKVVYSCCSAALQLAHSQVYSTAWECVRMIRCDSFSEIPQLRRDELDGEECDANVQRGNSAGAACTPFIIIIVFFALLTT